MQDVLSNKQLVELVLFGFVNNIKRGNKMSRIIRRRTKKREEKEEKGMSTSEMGERLAEIKSIIKGLDAEGSAIQEVLLDEPVVTERFKTTYGVLNLRRRANWSIDDKEEIIDYIGQEVYNDKSTISKAGIVAAVGELGLGDLETGGAVVHGKDTQYYQLTIPKKKQEA